MRDEQAEHDGALTELRTMLTDALTRSQLTTTQLATQARLSRATVQSAFQADAPAPSAETVVALARVLHLPDRLLLDLRQAAAKESGPVLRSERGPGKPIDEWDPHDLEVHPAGSTSRVHAAAGRGQQLPGYVPRDHDRVLAEAVQAATLGRSQLVVLVGSSSTGKTRACWEAVQPLVEEEWRLWHPFDPTRAQAALDDLVHVSPRTVVWLNDAQHYFGDPRDGERVAAAIHNLLTRPERRPILVLTTLWPEYAEAYAALPRPGTPDPHSRVRELLAGRTATVPDAFNEEALRTAAALADHGDQLLADALTRVSHDGRLAQDLAGAPELLRRFENSTPAARAMLEAAMDARRLGMGPHMSHAFLTEAALDYLSDADYDALPQDWLERVFVDLARPVHGKQAPLRRIKTRPQYRRPVRLEATTAPTLPAGPAFRLSDYLEQHGRSTRRAICPPASFWNAAHAHLTDPRDLSSLADAARNRHRLQWSRHLHHRAAELGDTNALWQLAQQREKAGDRPTSEALVRRAVERGDSNALLYLAEMRSSAGEWQAAEALYQEAAEAGNTHALVRLARGRDAGKGRRAAEALYQQAADAGDCESLLSLARLRARAGDWTAAEAYSRQAADAGVAYALSTLADLHAGVGHREAAKALYQEAADAGYTRAWIGLARLLEKARNTAAAEAVARQAADAGDTSALVELATMRRLNGNREAADALYQQAAEAGDPRVLLVVAGTYAQSGDREAAEALFRQAAEAGYTRALSALATLRADFGEWEAAEALARQAADAGDPHALAALALRHENAGHRDAAEALYRLAADAGNTSSLLVLTNMYDSAGDREAADALARRAADTGGLGNELGFLERRWPYGLEPDGTVTLPWE